MTRLSFHPGPLGVTIWAELPTKQCWASEKWLGSAGGECRPSLWDSVCQCSKYKSLLSVSGFHFLLFLLVKTNSSSGAPGKCLWCELNKGSRWSHFYPRHQNKSQLPTLGQEKIEPLESLAWKHAWKIPLSLSSCLWPGSHLNWPRKKSPSKMVHTSSNVDLDFGILVSVLVFRQTGSIERELVGGQRQAAVGSGRDQR